MRRLAGREENKPALLVLGKKIEDRAKSEVMLTLSPGSFGSWDYFKSEEVGRRALADQKLSASLKGTTL